MIDLWPPSIHSFARRISRFMVALMLVFSVGEVGRKKKGYSETL